MSFEDQIIDFLAGNDLKLGVVVREQKSKLLVEDANGRNERVLPGSVLVSHGPRPAAGSPGNALETLRERIEALAQEVDTELLREAACEYEAPVGPQALAQDYFGQASAVEQSAIARAVLANTARFKRHGLLFTARSQDETEQMLAQQLRVAEKAAIKERALSWMGEVLAGKPPDTPLSVPDDLPDFVDQVEAFVLQGHNTEAAKTLEACGRRKTAREAGVDLLHRLGRIPEHADIFLLRHGVFTGFSHATETHTLALQPYEPEARRTDQSQVQTFSIDDPGTREIDDALSIEVQGEEVVLGIHIADPACFIEKDDPLDRAAAERPLTLYLPTTTVRMLPTRVGCELASLNAGELRPTLSFRVHFDAQARMTEWTFGRAQIRVTRRLTYEQADAMLASGDNDPLVPGLCALQRITDNLATEREARGAVRIIRPEPKVRVKADSIKVTLLDTETPARCMVAECMILANRLSAEYGLSNDVPIIYRVQDPPSSAPPRMERYDPVAFDNAVRSMKRMRLSTHPQKHAGLGLDVYTQVSSPIRRYADLVIQRQLAAHLADKPLPYAIEELLEVLSAAERGTSENRNLERDATRLWLLRYLDRQRRDDTFSATLVAKGHISLAELDEVLVRGKLSSAPNGRLGDRIHVRIAAINPEQDLLVLECVS